MNRYQDWLDQAERDLGRATIDIKYEYWEWACFTSQQAAEKAVSAAGEIIRFCKDHLAQ